MLHTTIHGDKIIRKINPVFFTVTNCAAIPETCLGKSLIHFKKHHNNSPKKIKWA